jgi:tartrate-resistant acid phosphatase type 5
MLRKSTFRPFLACALALACQSRGGCTGGGTPSESSLFEKQAPGLEVPAPSAAAALPFAVSSAGSAPAPVESALLEGGVPETTGVFAVIGDYGAASEDEGPVADLVKRERPDFIITTGDNNYPSGAAATIDQNIGRFYADYIFPYKGRYGPGARVNRFFPSLGNHDWYTPGAGPYLDYFSLPGNERYYEFVKGDVHFFAVDSDPNEPDGIVATSVQAAWLKRSLAASTAAWQVVYMHHPPFSSGRHGSTPELQWPYGDWGADLVLAGHDHHYENLLVGGVTYIVNGLGGRHEYDIGPPLPGSRVRFNASKGAQFGRATDKELRIRFVDVDGRNIDDVVLKKP